MEQPPEQAPNEARRLARPAVGLKGEEALHEQLASRIDPDAVTRQYLFVSMTLGSPVLKQKHRHQRDGTFLPSETFFRSVFKLPAVVVVLFTADAQLVDKAFIRSFEFLKYATRACLCGCCCCCCS